MGLLKGLFGKRQWLTANGAAALVREQLTPQQWSRAGSAELGLVYASVFDTDQEIGNDGASRFWHVDFFSPDDHHCYLTRVSDGALKGWEKTPKDGKSWPAVEYVAAHYGDGDPFIEPLDLGDGWIDSADAVRAALDHIRPRVTSGAADDYQPTVIVLPARMLAYAHPTPPGPLLRKDAPAGPVYALLLSGEDLYEQDSFAVYVDARDGQVLDSEVFRFPGLFTFGAAADW